MKPKKLFTLILVFSLIFHGIYVRADDSSYTISPGDVLEISVWQHPELNRVVTVRPDGKVSFSLVGDVDAGGLTPQELDEQITKKLASYIQDPQVTVIVTTAGIRSKQVLVLGQVVRPGPYLIGERLSVLEAIALAGSYTDTAGINKVTVTRNKGMETGKVMKVDLKKVILEGNKNEDIVLEPGDIVYVPKKTTAWNIFDRWFVGGILPVVAFMVMIDTLRRGD